MKRIQVNRDAYLAIRMAAILPFKNGSISIVSNMWEFDVEEDVYDVLMDLTRLTGLSLSDVILSHQSMQ